MCALVTGHLETAVKLKQYLAGLVNVTSSIANRKAVQYNSHLQKVWAKHKLHHHLGTISVVQASLIFKQMRPPLGDFTCSTGKFDISTSETTIWGLYL